MTRYLPKKDNFFPRKENASSINFKLQTSNVSPLCANTPWSSSVLQRISSGTFQSRGTRARRGHCRWTGLAQVRTWSNGNYVDWKANTSVACVHGEAKIPGSSCSSNTSLCPGALTSRRNERKPKRKHIYQNIYQLYELSKSCYFLDQKSS